MNRVYHYVEQPTYHKTVLYFFHSQLDLNFAYCRVGYRWLLLTLRFHSSIFSLILRVTEDLRKNEMEKQAASLFSQAFL